jgi:hypothetical protein
LPAHFAELSAIRTGQNQCRRSKAWKMCRGLTVLMMNFRDLYVGLGVDGTKSKEERINLVETIKGLQKYVQSYKVDNERLMKAKEQQDDFNVKLMQSLDIIEKKMDKETESSRSRSHRSHDEKRREARVLIGNITIHQSIHLGKCAVAQVHLLIESIREGLGWMSYREK